MPWTRVSDIADRIRYIRELLGLSQKDFAEKISVDHYMTILRYEGRKSKPTLSRINAIAAAGETTSRWLLTGLVDKKVCNDLVSELHRNTVTYETAAHLALVPIELILSFRRHIMEPSPHILNYLCDVCKLRKSVFDDYLFNIDNYGIEKVTGISQKQVIEVPDVESNSISEITKLLVGDPVAQKKVLDILKARKAQSDAENILTSLPNKSRRRSA